MSRELGTPAGTSHGDKRWPWSEASRFTLRRSGCAKGFLHDAGKSHKSPDSGIDFMTAHPEPKALESLIPSSPRPQFHTSTLG